MDSARGSDKIVPLAMPERYVKEMIADWRGAGKAYGNPDTAGWYLENRDQIQVHYATTKLIHYYLHWKVERVAL